LSSRACCCERAGAPSGEAAAPSARPSATPSASAITPAATIGERVAVRLAADDDISEVRAAGAADIRFGDREVELSLPRSNEPVTITVRFVDGSELSERVVPKESLAIRVRRLGSSPAEAPRSPPAPGSKKPEKNPASSAPGLEANPYE
jgi:hypothetical protein